MVPKENMTGFKRPGPATSPAPASEAPKSTKRARYSTALDCEIMEEVNGDNGLFNRGEKESKEKRWEMIADALQTALADKNESGCQAVRKHVEDLHKKHLKRLNKERKLSGEMIVFVPVYRARWPIVLLCL
jgi:hypothetical protein